MVVDTLCWYWCGTFMFDLWHVCHLTCQRSCWHSMLVVRLIHTGSSPDSFTFTFVWVCLLVVYPALALAHWLWYSALGGGVSVFIIIFVLVRCVCVDLFVGVFGTGLGWC